MIRNILKYLYFKIIKVVFSESRFYKIQKKYLLVTGCTDIDLKNKYHKGNLPKISKPIQKYCDELLEIIYKKISEKKPYTIIRASDGEAFFLQKKAIGNVTRRHFTASIKLSEIDISPFYNGLLSCDLKLQELNKKNRRYFRKIFSKNIFSEIPFEALYAIMANRSLYRNNFRIGLIGSEKKLDIIKKLLEYKDYREYIGRTSFDDYIGIPETGAANDPEKLAISIGTRMKNNIDMYLIGIGIAKLAVIPLLIRKTNSVLIDAGAGISALAGCINKERQYFADWTNYRLKNFNYSNIDNMDFDKRKDKAKYV